MDDQRTETHTSAGSQHDNEHHDHQHTSNSSQHHLSSVTAPFPFFHPTRAEGYHHSPTTSPTGAAAPKGPVQESSIEWSSRASRKRIYKEKPVTVQHNHPTSSQTRGKDVERETKEEREPWDAQLRIRRAQDWKKRPKGRIPTADVTFWVAVIFTLGSVAWVINAFLLYMPLVSSDRARQVLAVAWAFVGGTLFELGGYLMYVEALNTGHGDLFGPSLESLIGAKHGIKAKEEKKFYWRGRRTWRDLGFLASAIQLAAASIFWVSTLTGLPGVISGFPESSNTAITDIFYWTPQVIGGWGFIIASLLLMLEEQKTWYTPNVRSLGWHVGLWNLIGGTGFMLCGALGYASLVSTKANYQSVLSTFWGSWAFLIGSLLQLYEACARE